MELVLGYNYLVFCNFNRIIIEICRYHHNVLLGDGAEGSRSKSSTIDSLGISCPQRKRAMSRGLLDVRIVLYSILLSNNEAMSIKYYNARD